MIIIDQIDGKVVSGSKNFFSDKPSNKINISPEAATDIAKTFAKNNSIFNTNSILQCQIKIVNPDFYWTNPTLKLDGTSKYAYEITFSKAFPITGEASIWIDAENGNNLGGYQTK